MNKNKIRKCKCCRQRVITKKCFLKPYKKTENYCKAWKLWYDKKSPIICSECNANIMDFINRIDEVDFKEMMQHLAETDKDWNRPLRAQIWYMIDLGIITPERFK